VFAHAGVLLLVGVKANTVIQETQE
jgi:hypothetical protein